MKLDTAIKEYMISLSSSQGMSDNTISNYARDLNKYRDYLKEKEIEDKDEPLGGLRAIQLLGPADEHINLYEWKREI